MTPTGRYLVMRYAEVIGYSNGRRIVTVAGRSTTIAGASARAQQEINFIADQNARWGDARRALIWIAEVGRPAHRSQRQKGSPR